jgi:pheromone a factor receptor
MADLAISLGLPIFGCIIAYIPQGRRYNILEDIGCYPRIYNTPVAFVLVYSLPIVIGLVSAVYCSLTIREFARRRMQFKTFLSSNNNLNSNRYFRLMFLASIEILFTIPICIWIICMNARIGIEPWISWADTHSNWNVIQKFPAFIWRGNTTHALLYELTRWLYVLAAFVFFGFFGFADEARKNYRNMFSSVAKRVGYSTGTMSSGITSSTGGKTGTASITFKGGAASLPIFVRKETTRSTNLDSIASFDEKDTSSVFGDVKEKDYSPTSTSSGSSTSSLHDRDYSPPTHPAPAVVSPSPRHLEVPTNIHDVV